MIRAGRLACAGLIALVSSLRLPEREARAGRITATLAYVADSGCPDATEFKSVVVGRLGYDPFLEGSTDHVLVRLERRAGGGMHGRIEWRDAAGRLTGEQSFPSAVTECSGLARAVGFALAVQIQFLATANPGGATDGVPPGGLGPPPDARREREVAPAPSPASAADPAPATERQTARPEVERPPEAAAPAKPPEEIAVSPEPREARSTPAPTLAVGAGPSIGFGFSASPVALGRLFGSLSWQRLSMEIAVAASLPETIRRKDAAGFEQQHVFGSGALCGAASRWNGCLLANAGRIWMAGQNIDLPTSATVALVQVGLRAGLVQTLGRWAFVHAHADGLVNVIRWTGSLDQVPVWTAPRFGAALGVDVGVRFR